MLAMGLQDSGLVEQSRSIGSIMRIHVKIYRLLLFFDVVGWVAVVFIWLLISSHTSCVSPLTTS